MDKSHRKCLLTIKNTKRWGKESLFTLLHLTPSCMKKGHSIPMSREALEHCTGDPFPSSLLLLPTLRRLKPPRFCSSQRCCFDSKRHQYFFKDPYVILMCSQVWEPLCLICPDLYLHSHLTLLSLPLKICSHYLNFKRKYFHWLCISTNHLATYILKK